MAKRNGEARRSSGDGVGRRRFGALTLASLGAALAAPAIAQAKARVVVVGGGSGGAAAARHLAKDAQGVQVTLVNERPTYTSGAFANLYLAGYRSLRSLTHRYDLLASRYGVRPLVERATAVDRERREVRLGGGGALPYDRLILAPGVGLLSEQIEGYDASAQTAMPHGYLGGYQSYLLRKRLRAMRPGGVFLIAAPLDPYRCPPAPYERASMAALYFSRVNPTAKILILDAKDGFVQQNLFQEGWARDYPGMIEWTPASLSGGGIVKVDAGEMTATTGVGEAIKVDVASIIPPQRAGEIAVQAGLTDRDGWAPVDGADMRSLIDARIFVLGDAARAGDMPKSAFSANSQAHRAALAVQADLREAELSPASYRNTLWSFIGRQNVVKAGADYRAEAGAIREFSRFASASGESAATRLDNALEANAWYAAMTADAFA